jgi:alkanesulfonate monooxygenase SsuD/methylene tetrahydromethanopterin reductase-like flavin-dependent oxidoreductase (luciferase family)
VWTDEIVHHAGTFHDWPAIGIAPRPRRVIPLWFGGTSRRALRRVARHGDGWIPPRMDSDGHEADIVSLLAVLDDELAAAGRSRGDIGLEGRASWNGCATELQESIAQWRELGADRVAIAAQFDGDRGAMQYAEALGAARAVLA